MSAPETSTCGGGYLHKPFFDPNADDQTQTWTELATQHDIVPSKSDHTKFGQLLNLWASLWVAGVTVVTGIDFFVGCVVAIGSTLLYHEFAEHYAVNMSWNIVSLAVVFPISQGIAMAFKRRETALTQLATLLGHMKQVWGAVHTWVVKKDDETITLINCYDDVELAKDDVARLFEETLMSLVTFFHVPRSGRMRHAIKCSCCCNNSCATSMRSEQQQLSQQSHKYRLCVTSCIFKLQMLVQDIKRQGLPGGEAHRLDQYLSKLSVAFDILIGLKEYRTPFGFRAFARTYILLISVFYGPYYVYLGKTTDLDGNTHTNIEVSIVFACLVQAVLSGLFHVMLNLEDPFGRPKANVLGNGLDSIRVVQMVDECRAELLLIAGLSEESWRPARKKSFLHRGQTSELLLCGLHGDDSKQV